VTRCLARGADAKKRRKKLAFSFVDVQECLAMANNVFLGEAEFQKIFKDHLRIEAFPKSIESLFGPRMRTKVNYSPYYQRHYVWDSAKASYFIESILLGTEIPPLVFFNSNNKIEVIDGRQRYETIKRFMDNALPLVQSGLDRLKKLARATFSKLPNDVSTLFLDTKLRIIQFEIIGEPPLDAALEDKIKKEIFRRYNTGITPLRKAELDNAVYDSDDLTIYFKRRFEEDPVVPKKVQDLFLHTVANTGSEYNLQQVLQFIRRIVVQHKYPIKYYARSSGRSQILDHLYECFAQHDCEDPKIIYSGFKNKLEVIWKTKQIADDRSIPTNRFFWECLFWAMLVCDEEGKSGAEVVETFRDKFLDLVVEKKGVFFADPSHYVKVILERFFSMAQCFRHWTGVDFSVYLDGTEEMIAGLKASSHNQDTETQVSQLGELRVNKPDPSKVSVDDIIKTMGRRRFLLRPSYQRGEVISATKASGIIESMLLDVALPPIFVFRRKDDISEVVDGQQRLLTILGFIGERFLNEKNEPVFPKITRFSLKELRILPELSGKRFEDLNDLQKGRLLDFELFVVDIQESLNSGFDPVDLFVRLNDRPFPIKEHSFEMWNSWADKDCTTKIKENTERVSKWFYVRKRQADDRYRMQNEELYTALVFFDYIPQEQNSPRHPAVFAKRETVAARVRDKAEISSTWAKISEDSGAKGKWLESIAHVESFLRKLKTVLIDEDVKGDIDDFLRRELDAVVKSPGRRYAVRSFQDFYFIWLMLGPLNPEMVRFHRLEIKAEMKRMMQLIRTGKFSEGDTSEDPLAVFNKLLSEFLKTYEKDERQIKLTTVQKAELIQNQKGKCAISGAPIFEGDDLAIDHREPLATGGPDALENLQIATPEANSKKGPRQ
jgi:uncharacterized protein with ParB-like and HNH nuclease domain